MDQCVCVSVLCVRECAPVEVIDDDGGEPQPLHLEISEDQTA